MNGEVKAAASSTAGTLWWGFLLGIGFTLGSGAVKLIAGFIAAAAGQGMNVNP